MQTVSNQTFSVATLRLVSSACDLVADLSKVNYEPSVIRMTSDDHENM